MKWIAWKMGQTGLYLIVYHNKLEVNVDKNRKDEFLMRPKELPEAHYNLSLDDLIKLYPKPERK